jgi:predicted Rossmann-fold nucleotide-binding protein
VGGGFGTLSEIALALRTGTPVVGLATWSLGLDAGPVEAFPVGEDAEAAARLVLEAARSRRAGPAGAPGHG